jgi:thiol-disulfide isomerase/thioredoxin
MVSRFLLHRLALPPAVLVASLLLAPVLAQRSLVSQPVLPGDPFPARTFENLNSGAGGTERIDLAQYLGQKPVVLLYWIAGNRRSEDLFLQLQELVQDVGADRIALLGVAVPRPNLGEDKIRARIGELGIRVPVLSDVGFGIGKQLRVGSVPNLTILDAEGRLRLTNGASLSQVLGYELDLAKAIRRTAETGQLMTHGYLDRYFPVRELEGKPCPDFKAPTLEDPVERSWHGLLDDGKVNVLIFWSVDCTHCRASLPGINAWLEEHPDGVNVVSCASVKDEAERIETAEFCKLNGFGFPTLVDRDSEVMGLYKITSTPTILIIGPDGVVDSAILSGHSDFGRTIEKKKQLLLATGGAS